MGWKGISSIVGTIVLVITAMAPIASSHIKAQAELKAQEAKATSHQEIQPYLNQCADAIENVDRKYAAEISELKVKLATSQASTAAYLESLRFMLRRGGGSASRPMPASFEGPLQPAEAAARTKIEEDLGLDRSRATEAEKPATVKLKRF